MSETRSRSTKTPDPLFKTPKWRALRKLVLTRDRCTCRHCGRHVPGGRGLHVDHVVPRSQAPQRTFDATNLQTLCRSCHSLKTATEDGGYGNPTGSHRKGGCTVDGEPLESTPHW